MVSQSLKELAFWVQHDQAYINVQRIVIEILINHPSKMSSKRYLPIKSCG